MLIGAGLMAGCASSTTSAVTPGVPQAGPLDTGTYPNLNVRPDVAATQITDDDKARLTGRLEAAQSIQTASGSGAGTTGDPQHLQKLAAEHGDETLKAIAAK